MVESPLLDLFKALTALNRFYSLRDLEQLLGVPFQSLWKYVNLVSVPRRSTVERILRRVEELGLVERALEIAASSAKSIEALVSDPGFLRLFSIAVARALARGGARVDTLIPLSVVGIPLATALALEIGACICAARDHDVRLHGRDSYVATPYVSSSRELRIVALPRNLLRPRSRAALVDAVLEDETKAVAVADLARRRGCSVVALVTIFETPSARALAEKRGIKLVAACGKPKTC
ncbi:MAG: hypothetical protein GXO32_03830 [Crenarchaeota archaeon]|nr:hypothetical protein [Thermoproteota archaeon]